MCTAITFNSHAHYFGRNLDLERTYGESVTVTPRRFPFHFRKLPVLNSHFAMIGTSALIDGYPLYYEATNEFGLSIAGLNFVGNAKYGDEESGKINLAQFEFIPYILGLCKTVTDVNALIEKICLIPIPFNSELPVPELHWLIADKDSSITVESMSGGIRVYENPVGVLTNNPPFDFHMTNLNNYINLTSAEATNRFSDKVGLDIYSRGMGGIGLPGDLSSASRFVRATFVKSNSVMPEGEDEAVGQFFHILGSVEQQEGCVSVGELYERTQYSSCCNTDSGDYYYRTYSNSQICKVSLRSVDLDATSLYAYPHISKQHFFEQN